jgi:anaerobic dimethyl sulfoxide reductase subunit A
MGESKTDFQIFTELAYRLGFGPQYNPRANRDSFLIDDNVDEAYLSAWWHDKVIHHQGVTMSWEEFKQRGVYKFKLDQPHVAFRAQIEQGMPFQPPSGRIEIFSTQLAQITHWTKTQYGYPIPAIPKWVEPWEYAGSDKTKKYPFHHDAGVGHRSGRKAAHRGVANPRARSQ